MKTVKTMLVATLLASSAACATDDPAESESEQGLSGLIYEGNFVQTWVCTPGSVEDTGGEMYQPYIYQIGYQWGCSDFGLFKFCGFAWDESQVTHAWYSFVDYQGNQYCDGVIHYRIWQNWY